jgi:hypothetical protein
MSVRRCEPLRDEAILVVVLVLLVSAPGPAGAPGRPGEAARPARRAEAARRRTERAALDGVKKSLTVLGWGDDALIRRRRGSLIAGDAPASGCE